MLAEIALLICIPFIATLLWMDRGHSEGVSGATWIPLIWLFIAGSRFVSRWLDLGAPGMDAGMELEGSPVDRAVFLILIVTGAAIVSRRGVKWDELLRRNRWMCLFFAFGLVSILWSEYPFVSFKRWIKALGNVVMILVLLTEDRPYEAIGVVLRRIAIFSLPLSILFIKYYPHLGRAYSVMGNAMFTGVSDQKNGLGQLCLVSGIYFLWSMLYDWRDREESGRKRFFLFLMILPMIGWLFHASNSATSLMCMVVAVVLFVLGRHPAVASDSRKLLAIGIACIVILMVLEHVIDLSTTVIAMLGRQPDLTTRVPMWHDLLSMVRNPVIGYGYESFWLGERRFILLDRWGVTGQAHNGYLQVYLDLGLIGIFLLGAWVVSGIRKAADQLSQDYPTSILRLCLLVVIVLYNWTEASFYGASLIWSLFIMGGMDIPERHPQVEYEEDAVDAWGADTGPDGNHADGRQWKTDAAR